LTPLREKKGMMGIEGGSKGKERGKEMEESCYPMAFSG